MLRIGFAIFFAIALLGDFIANEKPLYCKVQGKTQFPAFRQKAVDWHLAQADSSISARNWLIFNEYESVIKAPIPFSAGTLDSNDASLKAPFESNHWLGTDRLGRDLLAGLIHGCGIAFWIGLGATLLATILGILLGGIAGFLGGFWDTVILKIIEIKQTIPSIFWILTLSAVLNRCTIFHIILIIGGLAWTTIALLMRSALQKVKTEDYITAAKTLGLSQWQIFFKHALPNSLSPIYVAASFLVTAAILTEAALSFLGIGLPFEEVTWGSILHQGQSDMSAWWLLFFPGFCIFLVVILVNSFGERLRSLNK
jgi:peptide/nickel transport system permease protein